MIVARRAAAAACLIGLCAGGPAAAAQWRFCVGVAPASHRVVITGIFASDADSATLQRDLQAYMRDRKGETLTFLCPRGAPNRTQAIDAQNQALQFDRNMGFSVNDLPAADVVAAVEARN